MSAWPGKYVIGLTGNIATGKSLVRRMLEDLGAEGIDADRLANQAILRGAPAYQPVLDLFGTQILGADGQIDRAQLGSLVFSDPVALKKLESVVHPVVGQALDRQVRNSKKAVIVIEAIKLIEAELHRLCDVIWVTHSPQVIQVARLVKDRGLSEATAWQRIRAQPVQEEKIGLADVILSNQGGLEQLWKQVEAAWDNLPATAYTGGDTLSSHTDEDWSASGA